MQILYHPGLIFQNSKIPIRDWNGQSYGHSFNQHWLKDFKTPKSLLGIETKQLNRKLDLFQNFKTPKSLLGIETTWRFPKAIENSDFKTPKSLLGIETPRNRRLRIFGQSTEFQNSKIPIRDWNAMECSQDPSPKEFQNSKIPIRDWNPKSARLAKILLNFKTPKSLLGIETACGAIPGALIFAYFKTPKSLLGIETCCVSRFQGNECGISKLQNPY